MAEQTEQPRAAGEDGSHKSGTTRRHHRRHRGHARMAPCPACGRMIGRRWTRCPFCGDLSPFGVGSRTGMAIIAAIAIPGVLFLIGYLIATVLGW